MKLPITLSKLDVAARQLESAVLLYFNDRDPVSVHTLTAAAYNVLQDLAKRSGTAVQFFKDGAHVRPQYRKEFREAVNSAENYFKHADRDASATYQFRPIVTQFLLYEACHAFSVLSSESRPTLLVFRNWFAIRHPQYWVDLPDAYKQLCALTKQYTDDQKIEYFQEALATVQLL